MDWTIYDTIFLVIAILMMIGIFVMLIYFTDETRSRFINPFSKKQKEDIKKKDIENSKLDSEEILKKYENKVNHFDEFNESKTIKEKLLVQKKQIDNSSKNYLKKFKEQIQGSDSNLEEDNLLDSKISNDSNKNN